MKNRLSQPPSQADELSPLLWAEKNLSAIAKHTAAKMNGGEGDTLRLAAVFAILRARQDIRTGLHEVGWLQEAAR